MTSFQNPWVMILQVSTVVAYKVFELKTLLCYVIGSISVCADHRRLHEHLRQGTSAYRSKSVDSLEVSHALPVLSRLVRNLQADITASSNVR